MNVNIKKFSVLMELKNSGMELEIRNPKNDFLGDIVINKSGLIWCKGKTTAKKGIHKPWEDIIEFFESAEQVKKKLK